MKQLPWEEYREQVFMYVLDSTGRLIPVDAVPDREILHHFNRHDSPYIAAETIVGDRIAAEADWLVDLAKDGEI